MSDNGIDSTWIVEDSHFEANDRHGAFTSRTLVKPGGGVRFNAYDNEDDRKHAELQVHTIDNVEARFYQSDDGMTCVTLVLRNERGVQVNVDLWGIEADDVRFALDNIHVVK